MRLMIVVLQTWIGLIVLTMLVVRFLSDNVTHIKFVGVLYLSFL